jgi:hypothetical protein
MSTLDIAEKPSYSSVFALKLVNKNISTFYWIYIYLYSLCELLLILFFFDNRIIKESLILIVDDYRKNKTLQLYTFRQ